MRAVTHVSSVTNLVMVAAEMALICVKNVPMDMSYAMECVRVRRNPFLSFFLLYFSFSFCFLLWVAYFCVFRLIDFFAFCCCCFMICCRSLKILSSLFLFLLFRSYKRKTRQLCDIHTLLSLLWSLRDCLHYFSKFNMACGGFWCHCGSLHFLFGVLA